MKISITPKTLVSFIALNHNEAVNNIQIKLFEKQKNAHQHNVVYDVYMFINIDDFHTLKKDDIKDSALTKCFLGIVEKDLFLFQGPSSLDLEFINELSISFDSLWHTHKQSDLRMTWKTIEDSINDVLRDQLKMANSATKVDLEKKSISSKIRTDLGKPLWKETQRARSKKIY